MAGAEDPKKGSESAPQRSAAGAAQTMPAATAGTAVLDPADALAATRAAEAIANATSSLVGATIAGRYKVQKRLGEGGMGTVYQALHTVLEKPVALKVLHAELARKSHLVERFLQEAKAASRIRHVNVIDISDFGSADGHVYFAMELLDGHDLHEEITRARSAGKLLPWARSKNIFLQVCSALAVAHERGIVHRDLKPENIYLVDFRGDPDFVKLLDFGIAKLTDVSDSEEGRKLTKTGMLFGTPEYMAPEQARGETADHRADIYAMGCLLFLLVSNRLPFQAENFMGVLSQHLIEEPPEIAPATFDQIGAPREIAEVIDRALEKNREDRWQTIDELAAAICEVCGDPPPKERSRPHRAPSVDAPGETTRSRTPTDPARSRTPSGSQRMKNPTGPRSRTPTGPASPPRAIEASWVGSAAEIAAHVEAAKAGVKTPEVSWVGSSSEIEKRASAVSLGPVPEPEQKGHVFAIVSAIVVVGTIAVAAYALGWFSGDSNKTSDVPAAKSGSSAPMIESGSQGAAVAEPPAPTPAVPAATEPEPSKSPTPVKPTKANEPMPRTPRTPTKSEPTTNTSAPVTKPDVSTAVTKPDTTPTEAKPDKVPEPEAPKPEAPKPPADNP